MINLRGVRESGLFFSVPTYVYLVSIFGVLGLGFFHYLTGTMPVYEAPAAWSNAEVAEPLGLLLILRAFSSGVGGPDRHRGRVQRRPGVQAARGTERADRHRADGHVLRPDLPGHELPCGPARDPAGPNRAGNGGQPAHRDARGGRSAIPVLGSDLDRHPARARREHVVRRLPAAVEHPRPRRLPAPRRSSSVATGSRSTPASSCWPSSRSP